MHAPNLKLLKKESMY